MESTPEQDAYLRHTLDLNVATYQKASDQGTEGQDTSGQDTSGQDSASSRGVSSVPASGSSEPDLTFDTGGGKSGPSGVTKTPEAVEKDITDKYAKDIPKKQLDNHASRVTNFQDDATFQKELLARHPDLIKEGYDPKTINGESYDGKIYINKDKANGGTPYHEQLHHYSSPDFKSRFYVVDGVKVNEGVTEYFTRKMYSGSRTGIYDTEEKVAEAIAKKVGDGVLKKAYFQGDEDAMKKVTDALSGK